MKAKGHNICDTLKAIRKQIADANGIDYSPEECHFTGECKGTCPKCEQDVRYLEHELRLRLKAGKAIKVAGVALGIIALAASITSCSTQKGDYNSTPLLSKKVIPIRFQEYTSKDSILLKDKESLGRKESFLSKVILLTKIRKNRLLVPSSQLNFLERKRLQILTETSPLKWSKETPSPLSSLACKTELSNSLK